MSIYDWDWRAEIGEAPSKRELLAIWSDASKLHMLGGDFTEVFDAAWHALDAAGLPAWEAPTSTYTLSSIARWGCGWEITYDGILEPCGRPVVAAHASEWDGSDAPYGVCAAHVRKGHAVPFHLLADLLARQEFDDPEPQL